MIKVEVKYCPKDKSYYLQCAMDSRSLRRHIEETDRKLSMEASQEERAKLRVKLENLARERAYMTDYILLKPEEVPAGSQVRRLPKRPSKLVTVDGATKKWLLLRVPTPAQTEAAAPFAGRCYDFPAEEL